MDPAGHDRVRGAVGADRGHSAGRAWHYVASSGYYPVDLPTVAHPHDEDDEPLVHDLVDDPVIARSASLAKYRSIASSRALKSSMGTTAATGWPLRVMVVGVPPALA